MNISKLSPVFCALTVSALCLTVRAEDNPAQAAARLALAKQLFEQDSHQGTNSAPAADNQVVVQTKATANAAPATVATTDSKAKKSAKKKKRPAQPAVDATAASNATEAQAKPAAPAKASWDTQQAAAPQPVVQPAPKPAPVAPPPVTHPAPAPAAQPVVQYTPPSGPGDNAAQAAARMALAKELFNEQGNSAPATTAVVAKPPTNVARTSESTPAPAPVMVAAKPVPATTGNNNNHYVGEGLGLKPIVAPPLPISAGKQARLEQLLGQYKADQITPEQYHQQRAAILAEP